jgi:diaminopimelate epimerase
VAFTKMSGAGNDFIVLDGQAANAIGADLGTWARAACRRGLSVGADGVLVVRPEGPDRVRVDFLNPDGSVAFCGNGTRCAARYAASRGYCGDRALLLTRIGEVPAEIHGGRVRLVLPPPKDRGRLTLSACGTRYDGRSVDSGVPHFVVEVEDVAAVALASIGPVLRADPAWGAAGANVDVVSRAADGTHHVRTWERGVENETLACGTGAIAAALAARLGGAPETVRIVPASGVALEVTLRGAPGAPTSAELFGDARFVFEGTLSEEAG